MGKDLTKVIKEVSISGLEAVYHSQREPFHLFSINTLQFFVSIHHMSQQLIVGRRGLQWVSLSYNQGNYIIHPSNLLVFMFTYLYIYIFFIALGLCCFVRALFSCSKHRLLFIVVHRLLIVVASLVEHRLQAHWLQQLPHVGSVAVAHRFSCSAAGVIFMDQVLNLCPLHWQVGSYPLSHQGSPSVDTMNTFTGTTSIKWVYPRLIGICNHPTYNPFQNLFCSCSTVVKVQTLEPDPLSSNPGSAGSQLYDLDTSLNFSAVQSLQQ